MVELIVFTILATRFKQSGYQLAHPYSGLQESYDYNTGDDMIIKENHNLLEIITNYKFKEKSSWIFICKCQSLAKIQQS